MNQPVYPPPMKKGDKAAIVAPASPVSERELHNAVRSLEYLGLSPVIMPCCDMRRGYLSGPDEYRAADMNLAFYAPDIRGIFCLRGGYGSARLLPLIDTENVKRHPKVFIGYSDITALHILFNQRCGLVTFHGPMPSAGYIDMDPFTLSSLTSAIFHGKHGSDRITNPEGQRIRPLYKGQASGILTGGNLSVLVSTLGTPYEIDTRDKILFIEEVNEPPYKIDRALTTLALAGKLDDCAGVILGTFAGCSDHPGSTWQPGHMSIVNIFQDIISRYRKPTLMNLRAGHVYPQATLPMGAHAAINENGEIILP